MKTWQIKDKCWYYSDADKRIKQGAILGFQDIDSERLALIEEIGTNDRSLWHIPDLYRTRDELCDYYREIFLYESPVAAIDAEVETTTQVFAIRDSVFEWLEMHRDSMGHIIYRLIEDGILTIEEVLAWWKYSVEHGAKSSEAE